MISSPRALVINMLCMIYHSCCRHHDMVRSFTTLIEPLKGFPGVGFGGVFSRGTRLYLLLYFGVGNGLAVFWAALSVE